MPRIEEIVESALCYQDKVEAYYDLFCDHGKIGLNLLSTKKTIFFNDKLPHLIEALKDKLGPQTQCNFSSIAAQELIFAPQSMVIAAGVGGLLMIECFEKWRERHPADQWESLIFLLCPAYYDSKLRGFLNRESFVVLDEWICKERGRYYDMQVVRPTGKGRVVGRSPALLRPENGPIYREYIEKELRTLTRKRELSREDLELMAECKTKLFM